jgi:hypothetical protein
MTSRTSAWAVTLPDGPLSWLQQRHRLPALNGRQVDGR